LTALRSFGKVERLSSERGETVPSFGISLAASVREPIGRIADLVVEAERQGFANAYVLDSQVAFKSAYVTLALCADRTSTIRLGTGVTNPLTRDLTVTASDIAGIHEVSGGRAVLGVGNGGTAVDSVGLKGTGLAATRAAVTTLRGLLDGAEVQHNGVTVRMQPAPSHLPIYLSGSQPKMLQLAGEVADGVILMGSSHPGLLQGQLDHVLAGLERSGRPRSAFHVDLWQTISVAEDRGQAIEDVKSWVASQLYYWFARSRELPPELEAVVDRERVEQAVKDYVITDHLSLTAAHRELVSPELADVMTIAGDRAHCVNRLRELSGLDVDAITLTLLSGGREARLATQGAVIAEVGGHVSGVS
jgi:5,10-methylenetetrahydromethanopterin reductase